MTCLGEMEHSWDLPHDLISEIIVHLPLRQIAQLVCVAKPWSQAVRNSKEHMKKIKHEQAWRYSHVEPFSLAINERVGIVSFAVSGNLVGLVGEGFVQVWDIGSDHGKQVFSCRPLASTFFICFWDGLLIGGDVNGYISGWDVEDNRLIASVRAHERPVWAIVSLEQYLASIDVGRNNMIRLWERDGDNLLRPSKGIIHGHKGQVSCLACGKQGQLLLSGSRDSTIKVWDVERGQCLRTLHHRLEVTSVSCSGDLACAGSSDYSHYVWNFVLGVCLRVFDALDVSRRLCRMASIQGTKICIHSRCARMRVFELQEEREMRTIHMPGYVVGSHMNGERLVIIAAHGVVIYNFGNYN